MKRELYKIFMIDDYTGKEYKYLTGYDRVDVENLLIMLSEIKYPCTSFCYYDNEGIRYDIGDILNNRGRIK